MTIFVGLGNHETKYHNTKHNVGYWVLDSFAKRYGLEFKPGKGLNKIPSNEIPNSALRVLIRGCYHLTEGFTDSDSTVGITESFVQVFIPSDFESQ